MTITSPIWYLHQNNADPSRFLHIYTRKVSPPHSNHYFKHPIYFPLCNTDLQVRMISITCALVRLYLCTSYHTKHRSPTTPQTDALTRRRHPCLQLNIHEMSWQRVSRHVRVTRKSFNNNINEGGGGGTANTPNVTCELNIVMSSAKDKMLALQEWHVSFTYNKYNKGPKSNLVAHHIRWIKVMINSFRALHISIGLSGNFQSMYLQLPVFHNDWVCGNNMLWSITSNALERSHSTASVISGWVSLFASA